MIISYSLHDYLRDTPVSSYKECISCKNRTQFTCVKCGYCYSCHWKKEELEKEMIQFKPLAIANSTFLRNYYYPQHVTATTAQIEEQSQQQHGQQQHGQQEQQEQQQIKVIDVYGQQTEPICSYHACHHKFSLHGHSTRICKCNHPQNHTVGVSIMMKGQKTGSNGIG